MSTQLHIAGNLCKRIFHPRFSIGMTNPLQKARKLRYRIPALLPEGQKATVASQPSKHITVSPSAHHRKARTPSEVEPANAGNSAGASNARRHQASATARASSFIHRPSLDTVTLLKLRILELRRRYTLIWSHDQQRSTDRTPKRAC